MDEKTRVTAVIVAAGVSTRMGDFKQLMKIGDLSMAERVVLNFKGAGIDDIVMVTGHRRKELEKSLKSYGITFLYNKDYETTDMFSSVKIGFSYVHNKADKILFTPVDIPYFESDTIKSLLDVDKPLVCPSYNDKIGHPLCIDNSIIESILSYEGDGGLRAAFKALEIIPFVVPTEDEGAIVDADKQGDFEKLKSIHSQRLARPIIDIKLAKKTVYFNSEVMTLLSHVDVSGSVIEAAEKSGISYSQAWKHINKIENELDTVIVIRVRGGESGGEAKLSKEGKSLLEKYKEFSERLNKKAKELYEEIF